MAEIEFFAVDEEIAEVVGWLLRRQCVMVPDRHYSSATIERLIQPLDIREVAVSVPHFFATREDFLESPLGVREVTTDGKHFFYIDPRTGGPSLQFYWGRRVEKNGRDHLSASWLSHYDWYQDSVSGERKRVSKELLAIYSDCRRVIRAQWKKIQPGKREFFISPSVENLVRSGTTTLIGLEGMSADRILGVSKTEADNLRPQRPASVGSRGATKAR